MDSSSTHNDLDKLIIEPEAIDPMDALLQWYTDNTPPIEEIIHELDVELAKLDILTNTSGKG